MREKIVPNFCAEPPKSAGFLRDGGSDIFAEQPAQWCQHFSQRLWACWSDRLPIQEIGYELKQLAD